MRISHPTTGLAVSQAGKSKPFNINTKEVHFGLLFKPRPEILLSTDYDGTLSPCIPEMAQLLNRLMGRVKIHLNTGRFLAHTKEELKNLQNMSPIQWLSLGNGTLLFENKKNRPTGEWIASLNLSNQDRRWEKRLQKQTGWNYRKTLALMHQCLEREFHAGKKTLPANCQISLVPLQPDGTEYALASSDGSSVEEFGHHFARRMITLLKRQGIRAQIVTEGSKNQVLYKIGPAGIDKSSPIEFLARRLKPGKAILTAGDAENDIPSLKREHYLKKPNIPFVCGDRAGIRQELSGHPKAVFLQSGTSKVRLDQAILDQLRRLKVSISPPIFTGWTNP